MQYDALANIINNTEDFPIENGLIRIHVEAYTAGARSLFYREQAVAVPQDYMFRDTFVLLGDDNLREVRLGRSEEYGVAAVFAFLKPQLLEGHCQGTPFPSSRRWVTDHVTSVDVRFGHLGRTDAEKCIAEASRIMASLKGQPLSKEDLDQRDARASWLREAIRANSPGGDYSFS